MGEKAIRADVMAASKNLNGRQAQLVGAFLESDTLSLSDCERMFPDIALQRDIKTLKVVGIIKELGHGPTDPARRYCWSCDKL